MTDWLLAAILVVLLGQSVVRWYNTRSPRGVHAESTPEPPPTARRRTRIVADAAWSPEDWGPPDSEVVTTEGDDYLARMHRPPPDDA